MTPIWTLERVVAVLIEQGKKTYHKTGHYEQCKQCQIAYACQHTCIDCAELIDLLNRLGVEVK